MKTFDEIARKFFAPDDEVPAGESAVPVGPKGDDAEFVIPECWKPKTFFQSFLLNYALNNASEDGYSRELLTSLGNCIDDFWDQHTTHETEIIFDGNLNFTLTRTVGESSVTASSAQFPIGFIFNLMEAIIKIDGERIPRIAPIPSYTGMLAELSVETLETGVFMCSVELSNVDADTFTDGEHYVVISLESSNLDLEPKTYKELLFGGAEDAIANNKMLPKTPEELAFALLTGTPVEFYSDSDDDGGGNVGPK